MSFGSHFPKLGLLALSAALLATPAIADVKTGVDAWGKGDFSAAVKEWREPAIKGDADAQFNMGQAYKMGRGVKADLDVALDWYRRAAAQGHLQASDSYGHLLHYQGKVPEALPYLQTSAQRGEPRSQYLLATELFNGVHTEKDWVRAYAFMTRASASGMGPASRSLAQMDQYIPLEDRQQGIVLAGELEKNAGRMRASQVAGFPINTAPPAATGRPVALPPAQSQPQQTRPIQSQPGFPSDLPVAGAPPVTKPRPLPPKMRPMEPAVVTTAPKPTPKAPVQSAAATGGAWRIQLGAFGNEANAQKLWNSLEGRVAGLSGLQPYLKAAGPVTRLQAGPFASRSAAEAMCAKVKASGQACIAVAK